MFNYPGGSVVNNPPANTGDMGSIPGLGRSPGEGNGNPLQDSCPENLHRHRSFAGCSSWGRKESGMTKHPHFYMGNKNLMFYVLLNII